MNNSPTRANQLDFKSIFIILWNGKFIIAAFFFASFFVSFYFLSKATPIYKAEIVLEIDKEKDTQSGGIPSGMSGLSLILSSQQKKPISAIYRVTGSEFLSELISQNTQIADHLDKYCKYKVPPILSIDGFFNAFLSFFCSIS